jgi:hypothetical protein
MALFIAPLLRPRRNKALTPMVFGGKSHRQARVCRARRPRAQFEL